MRKTWPLSAGEHALIRSHVRMAAGHRVAAFRFWRRPRPIVVATRERFDGTGYPLGLRGSDIPIGARVIAVAEAFDTLRPGRSSEPGSHPRRERRARARRRHAVRSGRGQRLAPLSGSVRNARTDGDALMNADCHRKRAERGRRLRTSMLVIVGALIVIGSVAGGYLMEGGQPLVLNQPAEFVIIGGAALGSLLIGTPPSVLKKLLGQMKTLLRRRARRKTDYTDLLAMLYQLFKVAQQSGVMALEPHFEAPAEQQRSCRSTRSSSARHHAVDFLADSIKVIIIGGIGAHDFEALMDEDLEVRHHEDGKPAATLNKVADALPGLGIVAAVLGVVITMGAIDGPAAEIGHKVGAALVGTFLGILLSYGFAQPLATQPRAARRPGGVLRAVHQGRRAGDVQGLLADGVGRVRAPRAARRSAADLRRDREAVQGRSRGSGGRGMSESRSAHHHRQEEGRPRRPSWRRVEGGLRRLRDRDDGVLPGDVAGRPEQAGEGRRSAATSAIRSAFDASGGRGVLPGGDTARIRRSRRRATGRTGTSASGSKRPCCTSAKGSTSARVQDAARSGRVHRDAGRAAHRSDRERRVELLRLGQRRAARRDRADPRRHRPASSARSTTRSIVEGHTDSRGYAATDRYSNWELSADRANAARRVMERDGLRARR